MSNVVDSRVVEMRFDNRNFESNVKTSLSTLERLKQALKLPDSSKSLEKVAEATKRVDFSEMGRGIQTVQARFSAMEVVALSALSNITNSLIATGRQFISTFTTQPIRDGFSEYELKMGSVQTIMASTGATLEEVNQYLEELNTYADKTIYSFSDMTASIGKFTNAGVDLDKAVAAIKGISNEAALSGANANEASRAMYNFAQALSAGYVKLIDWKSIENANMATKEFKQELIDTAVEMGTVQKKADGMYQSITGAGQGGDDPFNATKMFNDSLSSQWMTTEVLIETLKRYADETTNVGKRATAAAQDVKTFTQLMDTLKEAAGSGWAQTWEIMIGDFNEAKEHFTKLSKIFGRAIDQMSDSRNTLLKGAMKSNWSIFADQLQEAGISVEELDAAVRTFAKEGLNDFEYARSGFADTEKSLKELVQEGVVGTDLLRKSLDSLISTSKDLSNVEIGMQIGANGEEVKNLQQALMDAGFALDKFGVDGIFSSETQAALKAFQEANGLESTGIVDESTLEVLKKSNQELTNMDELLSGINKLGGQDLLWNSLFNSIEAVSRVLRSVKKAWSEVFDPVTSDQIYKVIDQFHTFTESLKPTRKQMNQITTTFKGLFSVLDLVGRSLNGVASVGMTTFRNILKRLNLDILGTSSSIGKLLTGFRDWVIENKFIENAVESANKAIDKGLNKLETWIRKFKELPIVKNNIEKFKMAFQNFSFDKFGNLSSVFEYIKENTPTISSIIIDCFSLISDLIKGICNTIPSIGGSLFSILSSVGNIIQDIIHLITENVSFEDILAGILGGGIIVVVKKISDFIDGIKETLFGLFSLGGNKDGDKIGKKVSSILTSVHDSLKTFIQGLKVASIIGIAIAIGILASALEKISDLKVEDIGKSLFAIGIMITMLCLSLKSMTKTLSGFNSKGLIKSGLSLILMATAVRILSKAINELGNLSLKQIGKGLLAVLGSVAILAGALKFLDGVKISLRTSIALIVLAEACKILGDALQKFAALSFNEIGRGLTAMGGAIIEIVAAIAVLNKFSGFNSLLGAVGLWIIVKSLSELADSFKIFGDFSWGEIGRGLVAMGGALAELVIVLAVLGKVAGFSSLFAAFAITTVIKGLKDLAEALKMFSEMSWDEIERGLVAMGGALAEVSIACAAVGKIAGFSGLLGGTAIYITINGLNDLAEALKMFSEMSWDEIGRGLVAMGGALAEVTAACTTAGVIAGFSGLIGGTAIYITIKGLNDLAESLKIFSEMSWDEIGRGLVAMGGALAEVSTACTAVGAIAGFSGLFGGGSIFITTQGLNDLAESLKTFSEMSWDEIKQGLVAMGGALAEVSVACIAVSNISGFSGLLGGASLWLAMEKLNELAIALQTLGTMSWGEIGRGLAAMGGALGELSIGTFLNTFGIIGSFTISKVAAPLGDLADSVSQWTNVTVPDGLGGELESLATGILSFTFGGLGALAISRVASPLGTLADSVSQWTNVTVPDGLGGDEGELAKLAKGIKAFTFSGIGATDLGKAVTPVQDMATAVSAWSGVSIPEGLGGEAGLLKQLAIGIKAFTFGGNGAKNLGDSVEPVQNMATSMLAWNDVNINKDIGDGLAGIATGLTAFAYGAVDDTKALSIAKMGIAMHTWSGITISEDLGANLYNVAENLGSFCDKMNELTDNGGMDILKASIADIQTATNDLRDSFNVISDIDISDVKKTISDIKNLFNVKINPEDMDTTAITSIGTAIKDAFSEFDIATLSDTIQTIATGISTMLKTSIETEVTNLKSIGGTIMTNIAAGITEKKDLLNNAVQEAAKSIKPVETTTEEVKVDGTGQGEQITSDIASGMNGRDVTSKMTAIMSATLRVVSAKASAFQSTGALLMTSLSNGLKAMNSVIYGAVSSAVSSGVSGASAYYSSFWNTGSFLGAGLVAGLRSKLADAYSAGSEVASSAKRGADDKAGVSSPAKEWIKTARWMGEGLVVGLKSYRDKVHAAGGVLAEAAHETLSDTLGMVANMDFNAEVQPTIRPVLDLSDVEAGVGRLGGFFGVQTVSLQGNISAINQSMSVRRNPNNEVVDMLRGLRSDISQGSSGNTYIINGVTYDDGTNIARAAEELYQAAKIQRRA